MALARGSEGAGIVMILIAGIESGLLAAISTSALAVAGQGTDSFSAFSQWALYAYAGALCVTLLAQMMVVASSPERRLPGLWGEVVTATSDAQCASAFLVLVSYTVGFSKSILMLQSAPDALRGGSANASAAIKQQTIVGGYAVSPHDSWYMAVIGDAYASWDQVSEHRTSSLLRLGPNGTTSSILAQVFAGAVLAYLLLMLLASIYTAYTASNRLSGRPPRLFLESTSLSTCNVFVVLVLHEAVEASRPPFLCRPNDSRRNSSHNVLAKQVGFQGCKYAGFTPNAAGGLCGIVIFAALGQFLARRGGRMSGGAAQAWLATAYAAVPTAIALARRTGRGDEPVLVASIALWALATMSAWSRRPARDLWRGRSPYGLPAYRPQGGSFSNGGVMAKATVKPMASFASLSTTRRVGDPGQQHKQQQQDKRKPSAQTQINWTLSSRDSLLPTLSSLQGQSQKHGRYVA